MNIKGISWLWTICFCFFMVTESNSQQVDKVKNIYLAFQNAMNLRRYDLLAGIDSSCIRLLKQEPLTSKQLAILYTVDGGIKVSIPLPTESLPVLTKAYKLSEKEFGKNSHEYLEAKTYLSWSYGYLKMHELEYKFYNELMDYYKTDVKKYTLEIVDMYNTIAISYGYNYGDWLKEQMTLDSGKSLLEMFQPNNEFLKKKKQSTLIDIYNSLSLSYTKSNNYENALLYAKKCLALRNIAAPESMENSISWMAIGKCLYQTEQNSDSSVYYLSKAVNAWEQINNHGPQWATYKAYKADVLVKMGRSDDAIVEVTAAIDYLLKSKLDPVSAGSLVQLSCIQSKAFITKRNYTDALKVCENTNIKIASTGGVSRLLNTVMNTQYSAALSINKNWDKAGNAFQQTVSETGITIKQLTDPYFNLVNTVPFEYLNLYGQVGNYLVSSGIATGNHHNVTAGINVLKKVTQAMERQKSWLFEAGVDDGIGAQDFNIYDDLLEALYNAKGMMDDKLRMADAFATIELSKANLLKNNWLQENRLNQAYPDSIKKKRLELKFKFYEVAQKLRENGSEFNKDNYMKAKETYMKYLQVIKKKYFFNKLRENTSITADDTLLTRHKGTIISYFLGTKALYAYVHENGSQKFIRKEIPATFGDDLSLVRKSCLTKQAWSDEKNMRFLQTKEKQWYQWLLGDVNVQGELVIIPHRQLSQISFEMLDADPSLQRSAYVIEKCPVRYALSASLMNASNAVQDSKDVKPFGGFAATNFTISADNKAGSGNMLSESTRGDFQTLESTATEVNEIASKCKGDAFVNTTPGDFIRNASYYRILHIATHALADQGSNHECILLFETDRSGNNMVRDIQIDSLQLHAQMAVLSACNTGSGKLHSSEGMLSLGRSFFIAGCPSVVMSLWTVNDASTSKIMSSFYAYLQQGLTKSEALRNAQLDYLKTETNPARKHPFYWAGFIIVGDNSSLSFNSSQTNWILWTVIGLLVIAGLTGLIIYLRKRSRSSLA